MKTVAAMIVTCLFVVAPALAQQTPTPPQPGAMPRTEAPQDVFLKVDGNADGSLTFDEIQKADSKATQADFDRYDADKSKTLTRAEFSKWTTDARTAKSAASGG